MNGTRGSAEELRALSKAKCAALTGTGVDRICKDQGPNPQHRLGQFDGFMYG